MMFKLSKSSLGKRKEYIQARQSWKEFRSEMNEKFLNPPPIDKSLKKVTKVDQVVKFINKLKSPINLTPGLLSEFDKYSLGKFCDDLCKCFTEVLTSKIDLRIVIEISVTLASRYEDFIPALQKNIFRYFKNQDSVTGKLSAIEWTSQMLRLLFELYLIGIDEISNEKLIRFLFIVIMNKKSDSEFIEALPLIDMFVEYLAEDLLNIKSGIIKKTLEELDSQNDNIKYDFEESDRLSSELKKDIMLKMKDLVAKQYKLYCSIYKLKSKEEEYIHAIMMETGDLRADVKEKYNLLKDRFIILDNTLFKLKDFLNLKKEAKGDEEDVLDGKARENHVIKEYTREDLYTIYETQDDLSLYVDLLNLDELHIKEIEISEMQENNKDQETFLQLLEQCGGCVNKETADQLLLEFFRYNNKLTRVSLVKYMTDFKNDYHLVLPYFARVIANIASKYPDIRDMLKEKLSSDFYLFKKRDKNIGNMLWDNRIRNMTYIGEATKYRIISPNLVISCIKESILEFNLNDKKVIVTALENCGRFLYLLPESTEEFQRLVEEVVKRMNESLNSSNTIQNKQIQTAILYCKNGPYLRERLWKKTSRDVEYLIYLLEKMNLKNTERISEEIFCLDWQKNEFTYLTEICCFLMKSGPEVLKALAQFSLYLKQRKPNSYSLMLDSIADEIFSNLDVVVNNDKQGIISLGVFIGELYNSCCLLEDDFLKLMNFLINFNSRKMAFVKNEVDCKENNFRLMIALNILRVVSVQLFHKPVHSTYVICLQIYALSKSYIDTSLEFDLLDTIRRFFPDLRLLGREEIPAVVTSLKNFRAQDLERYKNKYLKRYAKNKKPIFMNQFSSNQSFQQREEQEKIKQEIERQLMEKMEKERQETLSEMKRNFDTELNTLIHEETDRTLENTHKVTLQDFVKTNIRDVQKKTENFEGGLVLISRNKNKIEIKKVSDSNFKEALEKSKAVRYPIHCNEDIVKERVDISNDSNSEDEV